MENVLLMPLTRQPSIKGVFVQSHVETLRKTKGDKAVIVLEERLGRRAFFTRLENVPVKLEVAVIELVYDLLNEGHTLTGAARERAAGRLHFANFSETTFGSMLMHSMPQTKATFQTMLYNIGPIARSVIQHTDFRVEERRGAVLIKLTNNDYPPEHFAGFFEEWMAQWGLDGTVTYKVKAPRVHEYTIAM